MPARTTKPAVAKKSSLAADMSALVKKHFPDAAEKLFKRSQAAWGKPDAKEVSPKAQRLQKLIGDIPVCDDGKAAVTALISEITGEMIPAPRSDDGFVNGMLLVPLTCENSHNYKIGSTVLVVEDSTALRANGTTGNNLDDTNPTNARPATLTEARKFVASLAAVSVKLVQYAVEGKYAEICSASHDSND